MSKMIKFVVPLLDKCFSLEDISKDAGFIDLFTEDINRPYLEKGRYVHLMYEANIDGTQRFKTHQKLKSCDHLHTYSMKKIDGKYYWIYTFAITGASVKHLINGATLIYNPDRMRIYTFWNFKDKDVNDYMIDPSLRFIELHNVSIPEYENCSGK